MSIITTFEPVSRLCINCRERIFITEPVEELTCPRCGEVMRVIMARTVSLSRIPVRLPESAPNSPVVQKQWTIQYNASGRKSRTQMKTIGNSNIQKKRR
ncbi:MAG: hypothetical protein QCH31_12020 [Methanolobus sp.]|nr:hypothetical protein [Methanolobus sp.]